MGNLLIHFQEHLRRSAIIPAGSRGVVAVSGGIDSVVLLDLLVRCSGPMWLSLAVAHYNHGTRGGESDDDEAFVRALAGKWGLECHCSRMETGAETRGKSWEAVARERRYRFLESVRKENGYDWIATGHHADDQVETVIMRLVEGSGVQGLKGILSRQGSLVRPLLPFSRDQIQAHASEQHLEFREDSTNEDTSIPRNFIRHRIVPQLRQMNPSLSTAVSRLVSNVDEVDALVREEMDRWHSRTVSLTSGGGMVLDGKRLMESPSIVRKGLIRRLTSGGANETPWRHHVWGDVESFLDHSRTGQIIGLPGGWEMLKDRDRFLLRHRVDSPGGMEKRVDFRPGEEVVLRVDSFVFTMGPAFRPETFDRDPSVEYVDKSLLEGARIGVRTWQAGDRMKPLGLSGFKKVSDMLVDGKVDRFSKESQFVLTVNGKIAWLCGVRLDDRFKISPETSEVTRVTWRRTPRGTKDKG